MNRHLPRATAAALVASTAAFAQAPTSPAANPLAPMAFLAGRCFKSPTVEGKDTDEHCFQWLYEGKVLRDVHTVRGAKHPDLVGESTYYWDSAVNKIAYLYIEDQGGYMIGNVEPVEGMLTFPATPFIIGGRAMVLRTRWTELPDGYEAWAEFEGKDKQGKSVWATLFKVKMLRSSVR